MDEFQRHAKQTIMFSWKDVTKNYTVAWAGPLEAVEQRYPFISNGVSDIRDSIPWHLPLIIYQTRQSPPENMAVAIPYDSEIDLYTCRLISSNEPSDIKLLSDFAQALWLLIDTEVLPHPAQEPDTFKKELVNWTDEKLFEL